MRDNFRPNVRLTTNILIVIGTFLIAFNLSKISRGTRDSQIIEDCARTAANNMSKKELINKYDLGNISFEDADNFCSFYFRSTPLD